jgi:hypothetical protein
MAILRYTSYNSALAKTANWSELALILTHLHTSPAPTSKTRTGRSLRYLVQATLYSSDDQLILYLIIIE